MTVTSHRTALSRYERRTGGSKKLFEAAKRVIANGVSRSTLAFEPYPFYAGDAHGAHVTDVDGNSYLDLVNNYTSLPHGHGHAATLEAATEELRISSAIGTAHPLEAIYAADLNSRYPSLEKLRFTTTGSEATAFAARVARANTGRPRILKFEGGFHGSHNELYQDIAVMPPLVPGTSAPARPASAGLEPTATITAVYNDADSVRHAFDAYGAEIAGVIVEPFLGNGSLITAEPAFVDAIFTSAHNAGALVIFDEVQSLRAGYGGAQGEWGYRPDLTAIGKIMGGGFPLAAYGGRSELFEVFDATHPDAIVQTGTFTAAPMILAAGRAAMAALTPETCSELNSRTERLRASLRATAAQKKFPIHVNGVGTMFNISVSDAPVTNYRAHRAADTDALSELRLHMVNAGVLIMPRGTGCISTPMTDDDIQQVIDAFADAIDRILAR